MWSVVGHDVMASCCLRELCSGDVDLAWCRRSCAGIARRSACVDAGARGAPGRLSTCRPRRSDNGESYLRTCFFRDCALHLRRWGQYLTRALSIPLVLDMLCGLR